VTLALKVEASSHFSRQKLHELPSSTYTGDHNPPHRYTLYSTTSATDDRRQRAFLAGEQWHRKPTTGAEKTVDFGLNCAAGACNKLGEIFW